MEKITFRNWNCTQTNLSIMKKIILLISSVVISATLFAQLPGSGVSTQSGVLDGVYIQGYIPTKRVVQYPHLREADVMWGKEYGGS